MAKYKKGKSVASAHKFAKAPTVQRGGKTLIVFDHELDQETIAAVAHGNKGAPFLAPSDIAIWKSGPPAWDSALIAAANKTVDILKCLPPYSIKVVGESKFKDGADDDSNPVPDGVAESICLREVIFDRCRFIEAPEDEEPNKRAKAYLSEITRIPD